MDPAILGFILIGVMLFSIFVGFPISFTLIFLGFSFGYLGFGKLVFYLMTLQFSMVMTEQTLAAVPLFVFMGIMMEQAGLMERLFSAFQLMLAKVRGSLYYAVLFVSVVFAAATGIVGASVTILGIMAAKSMNKGELIGSIELKKKADIVAINLDSIFTQPVYNPLSSLLYNGNQGGVDYVWINGTLKLNAGQLENIDLDKLTNIAKSWKTKIKTT